MQNTIYRGRIYKEARAIMKKKGTDFLEAAEIQNLATEWDIPIKVVKTCVAELESGDPMPSGGVMWEPIAKQEADWRELHTSAKGAKPKGEPGYSSSAFRPGTFQIIGGYTNNE